MRLYPLVCGRPTLQLVLRVDQVQEELHGLVHHGTGLRGYLAGNHAGDELAGRLLKVS